MRFPICLLMCTMPLTGMESIPIQLDDSHPVQQQAEGILSMCLNSSGDPLKPLVIPRLVEKLTTLRESNPAHKDQIERAVSRLALADNAPMQRSLSTQEAFGLAENLLATTLHEIIGDKEQAALTEAQKKKWATVAAIAGAVGTVASLVAAILSSPITQNCVECVCNTTL